MSALIAALRISRRDIRRAKARSALIVVMIGLPVLAVTAVLTFFATRDVTLEEQVPMLLGTADARLVDTREGRPVRQTVLGESWEPRSDRRAEPRSRVQLQALLGQGARVVPLRATYDDYSLDGRYTSANIVELDLGDPMTKGMFPLIQGRYPLGADEVVATASRKIPLGATIRYTHHGTEKHVVGTVAEQRTEYEGALIGPPGSLFSAGDPNTNDVWLADLPAPLTWTGTLRLNQAGIVATSPAVLADPPSAGNGREQALVDHPGMTPTVSGMVTAAAGIALAVIEVVLLAGPAFAVGIRRRRRELALLSAQGASAGHLKLVVLADGLTLGLVATVLGSILGVGVARVAAAVMGIWPAGELGPFEVPVGQVVPVAVLGLVSGVVAAVVPAVQAARTDAATVLAGRRPTTRDRAGRPLAGLVLLVAGTAAMLYGMTAAGASIYLGGVLGLLGLVMVTPWLVRWIGGLAGGLPLPLRLAVRDASRNRGRTAPAIVAVLAAAAAFSTVAVGVTSSAATAAQQYWTGYLPGATAIYGDGVSGEAWKRIRTLVTEAFPGATPLETYRALDGEGGALEFDAERHPCRNCSLRSGPLRSLPVGGPDLLRFLLGRTDRAAEAALAEGKAVVFDPDMVRNGEIRLNVTSFGPGDEDSTVVMPAVGVAFQGPAPVLGVAPAAAVTRAGYVPGLGGLIVRPGDGRPDPERGRRLWKSVRAITTDVGVMQPGRFGPEGIDSPLWIMGALAALVVLGGTFAASGLAAADARPDLDTLSAVGARPRTRRAVAAGQAVVVAGLGVPLGLLVGLLPGFAMASQTGLRLGNYRQVGFNGVAYPKLGMVLSAPWLTLVAVGVGLPLLAALIALAFARTKVTATRRLG
ncbi:FtsX-like permease family protein [Streptosporangium sp. NPDC001559]|uniref:FtsX-like permease family protein n=1 Tax=Streptosporangium sp. NPDC001559 TaxID=3366187 RepID=UPI0036EF1CD7